MTPRSVVSDPASAAPRAGRLLTIRADGRPCRGGTIGDDYGEKSWSDPLFPASGREYVRLLEEPRGARRGSWARGAGA